MADIAISEAIADAYRRFLKREPDEGGLYYWTSVVVGGYASLDDVLSAIANSDEAEQYRSAQNSSIKTLQTEAELEAQALEIESYRSAIIDTGATQADQDFLNQQALMAKQRADLDLANMQAQAALATQSAAAAQAYAVEVRADVADMYRRILKREPDESGLNYWTNVIVSGDATAELVETSLSQSDEAMILGAYEQYMFRVPTMIERNNWLNAIALSLPVDEAINFIANSGEAQQKRAVGNDWISAIAPKPLVQAPIVPTLTAEEFERSFKPSSEWILNEPPGTEPLIVQTINPISGSAQAIDPIMGTSTWGTSYTNQDMIAADPVASPVVDLQNYYNPDVNISDLEPVSPIGDTSPALAFKARDEIYKAYTSTLKREPSEADYQYWEPLLVAKKLSLSDFKRYVAESDEAKALVKRTNEASLTDTPPPEVVADLTKKSEGVGAAVGLLSALVFFLGQ